jgi:hypothetical protein
LASEEWRLGAATTLASRWDAKPFKSISHPGILRIRKQSLEDFVSRDRLASI